MRAIIRRPHITVHERPQLLTDCGVRPPKLRDALQWWVRAVVTQGHGKGTQHGAGRTRRYSPSLRCLFAMMSWRRFFAPHFFDVSCTAGFTLTHRRHHNIPVGNAKGVGWDPTHPWQQLFVASLAQRQLPDCFIQVTEAENHIMLGGIRQTSSEACKHQGAAGPHSL